MPLIANYWNRGVRIFNPTLYLQGDDGRYLRFGTAVFTRGTLDPES